MRLRGKQTVSEWPKTAPSHLSRTQQALATIGVMVGMFLGALESTVVSAAMPTIVASLGGLTIYSWVFSSYLLTSTVAVPLWGRLSDIYGRRGLYLLGTALFLLGSALSGLSRSMVQLVLFRGLQGLGAGALLPLGLTIVGEIYPLAERARMQGYISSVWGLASIVGPVTGGYLADHFSWRWVFYLNIPFGCLAALIVGLSLRGVKPPGRRVAVDYRGALTLTASITLFLLSLIQRGRAATMRPTLGMLGLSLLFLVLFLRLEKRTEEPILPLSLFANRLFRSASLCGFLAGMAMFGAIVYIPLFVQGVIGTSATQAGSVLMPFTLGWVVCSPLGARLLLRVGSRRTVLLGTSLLSLGFLLLTRMGLQTTWFGVARNVAIAGAGMGFIMAPLLIAVQNAVPRSQLGIATSANMFFRIIGGAIGVALMGAAMGAVMQEELQALSRSGLAGISSQELGTLIQDPDAVVNPVARAALPSAVVRALQAALGHALYVVFLIGLGIAFLAVISACLIPAGLPQGDKLYSRRDPSG